MEDRAKKPILYILVNNHFDLMWRRRWDGRFTFGGQTYISYADIQAYYMLENLKLTRKHPEYKFEAESAAVVRKFLERHPERRKELRRLVRERRFAVAGAGDNIVDSNLVNGESLVRNFLTGLLWVERTLGHKTRLGVRNDAFGNSAQLPQILRGCELPWATGMSYSRASGVYWRGLDGSVIVHATIPHVAFGGGWYKYPPCPACSGKGCKRCGWRGIHVTRLSALPSEVNREALAKSGCGLVHMLTEELLPNPELIDWAHGMGREYDVRFALQEDAFPHVRRWLAAVDKPPSELVHDGIELNPNSTGCYVTRIKTKQTCRRQEYALLAAESLCCLAALRGKAFPRAALRGVWQDLLFTQFHDAIAGTHVDAAYSELEGVWKTIDEETSRIRSCALSQVVDAKPGVISVINPCGHAMKELVSVTVKRGSASVSVIARNGKVMKVVAARKMRAGKVAIEFIAEKVPALASRTYRIATSRIKHGELSQIRRPTIQNQRFRIEADEKGLLSVFDRRLGVDILKADEYRPGEFILEHDEGSPWATLHPDQSRTPLAEFTKLVAAEKGAAFQRLAFEVLTPPLVGFAGQAVAARTTVTLFDGIERADFRTHVSWHAFNHRLRVAMPVAVAGKHIYGVPYGMLERRPYQLEVKINGADGDWPAVNWAGVQGRRFSVALLNKGLPSYRMERGRRRGEVILLSILRSPTLPSFLDEPSYYTMNGWGGMADAGEHEFEYAVTAYGGPFAAGSVVDDAESYNAGLIALEGQAVLPKAPGVRSDNVRLAWIKWAEKGRALVLRLAEHRGRGGEAEVVLPAGVRAAARVNLLERQARPLEIRKDRVRLVLRPWEMATIRLEL